MGRVVGGAARGTVDHGGRGHRVACVVLAGRDAGRRSGHRGQGELLLTRMRGSIYELISCALCMWHVHPDSHVHKRSKLSVC